MNTNTLIRQAMRRDEQEVIDYVRGIRRHKATICSGDCWPPTYLWKARERLEKAGVIVEEAHFGRADTPRNRGYGIHFRAVRGAKPVTKIEGRTK